MIKNKLIFSNSLLSKATRITSIIEKQTPDLVSRLIKLASISLICSTIYVCTANAIVVHNPVDADKPIHVRNPIHMHKPQPVDKSIVVHKKIRIKTTASVLNDMYMKAGAGVPLHNKFTFIKFGNAKKSPKTTPVYNIGLGYRINGAARADLNLQYAEVRYKADNLRQTIRTKSAFINGYYDINSDKNIMPYLTAGIGVGGNSASNLRVGSNTYKGKDITNFVWNVGAGAIFQSNKDLALDIGYRYMDLGHTKTDNAPTSSGKTAKQAIRNHQILGSLVYSF
jgi:opacity protein-like surface antigen